MNSSVRHRDHVNGNDVGMAHAEAAAPRPKTWRRTIGVSRKLRMKLLDRDRAREAFLAHQTAQMHRRHAAGRDGVTQ